MTNTLNADLIYEILSVVEEIPEGRVATYGQIARMIGKDKNARLVGKVFLPAKIAVKPVCRLPQQSGFWLFFHFVSQRTEKIFLPPYP